MSDKEAVEAVYRGDAFFKCMNDYRHGTHRRDRLTSYRGRLECPFCRAEHIRSSLKYVGNATAIRAAKEDTDV